MKTEELFSVHGKVALVTGGSRGLGAMIARAYVENGARVYITARNAAACEALATELATAGECIALPGDVSQQAEIDRLGRELERRETRLDILVNNAGNSWAAPFGDVPEAGWDRVLDLNLKAPFFLTQRLVKLLEAAGTREAYARVINVGSIEGMRTSHVEAYPYSASKAALHHLTRLMAKFLAERHIAVNAIAPGYFPTKLTAGIAPGAIVDDAPMKRLGEPHDIAGVAIYLASRASSFVCGAVIPVDGGLGTTA